MADTEVCFRAEDRTLARMSICESVVRRLEAGFLDAATDGLLGTPR